MLNFQECQYPHNYIKMRFLENHDQPRICHFIHDDAILDNFTAFLYFLKGTTLLYAGQEFCCDHLPSLFERDVFPRTGRDISPLLTKLAQIKKEVLAADDFIRCSAADEEDIAIALRTNKEAKKLGVFSLKALSADVAVPFPDGTYRNQLDGSSVTVKDGMLRCEGKPVILTTK